MTTPQPWTAPEGMVACEVGPVVEMGRDLDDTVHYARMVGRRPIEDPVGIVRIPVYRPCTEDGRWL